MSKQPEYPLEQVALIKQKKLDEAEKVLRDKKQALQQEEEKLDEVEKERDEVKRLRVSKLTQLRQAMDEGKSTDKLQQMRAFLKIVDEQLKVHEKKVQDQQKRVDAAKQQVEEARQDRLKKQQAVEKMDMHRKEWEQEMKTIEERAEGVETDEMGSVLHARRARKRPPRGGASG